MGSTQEDKIPLKSQHSLPYMFSGDAAKQIALVVVAALVCISALWIWKSMEISNILAKDATERQHIKKSATDKVLQTNKAHLKLLAKPFIWAIRSEMISGNLKQVNLHIDDMIREKDFQKVVLTNDKGIVILSTDKKDLGKGYAFIGNPVTLLATSTLIDPVNDSTMILSSPVMGFNNRLGTLIITYSFEPPVFN